MALAPSITTAGRNAAADAVTALIGASGRCRIYSGTAPADANTALSGNTLLADLAYSATAYGSASGGVSTANAIASATAAASGTATFYRATTSGGTVVIQGSAGTSGCDLNVSPSAVITSGDLITVNSLTYTQAGS